MAWEEDEAYVRRKIKGDKTRRKENWNGGGSGIDVDAEILTFDFDDGGGGGVVLDGDDGVGLDLSKPNHKKYVFTRWDGMGCHLVVMRYCHDEMIHGLGGSYLACLVSFRKNPEKNLI